MGRSMGAFYIQEPYIPVNTGPAGMSAGQERVGLTQAC